MRKPNWRRSILFPIAALGVLAGGLARAEQADPLLHQACWIWWDKDTNAIQEPYRNSEFSFTKDFVLDGEARRAVLRITAESLYSLFVNGKQVGSDDNWQTLETYDIKPFLVSGKNRLLVKAKTTTWFAGLFVAGTVELSNGTALTILSDNTWDCSSDADGKVAKAEEVVRGLNGGWWNNCNRLMEMPERWYRPNTELVAPGIAWAKPYAGAKVKVLAIQPRATQRDTVELMHRTDFEVQVVFSDFSDRSGDRAPFFPDTRGWRRQDVAAEIAKALEGMPDVILLGPLDEGVFYEAVAGRLKALVQNGTGLIYTSLPARKVEKPGEKRPASDPAYEKELTASPIAEPPLSLTQGIPFESLPGFRIGEKDKVRDFRKVAALFQFGKGRVMRLGLAGGWGLLANAPDPSDLHYEYYQSFAIKSILWAAGKEPAVRFKDFPARIVADRGEGKAELAFGLEGARGSHEVTLAVRSPEKLAQLAATPAAQPGVHQGERILRPLHEAKASVQPGGTVRFALPPLPAGAYFLDVEAAEGGRKVNWATAALTLTSKIGIAELKLDPPWIDVADGKAAQLKATAILTGPAPDGAGVAFGLLDNYDRLLATKSVKLPAGADKAEAVFPVKRFDTTLGRVRAELAVGEDRLAVAVSRFSAVRRDWDRFGFFGWAATPHDHVSNIYARVLAGLGLDAGRGMVVSYDTLDAFDTVALPGYSGMPRNAFDITPASIKKTQEMTEKLKQQLQFDPVAYYCGDEIDYGGGDELPGRIAEFRKFLQARYRTIDALNRQWGTTCASFEEIYPITAKKDLSDAGKGKLIPEKEYLAQAKAAGNYSRWMDQWLNNYKAFNDMARVPRRVIKGFDPHARVGVDCPMWPFARTGHDWFTFLKEFEMFAPYGRDGEIQPYEEARSYARPGTLLGLEYGGYLYDAFVRREELTDVEWQHWRVWNGLLRGFTTTWWYQLTPPGNECSISPGFLPYPTLEQYARDLARIRSGFYTLYRGAQRDWGKIALHDSVPSRLMTSLVPDMGSESAFTTHFLMRIMQDFVGHPYTYVSNEQIANGALRDYQVLLMPSSLAIGQQEAAALRRFVRGGGVLIADVRPGLADESGKLGGNAAMAALFGVAWKPELGRRMLAAELSGQYRGVPFKNKMQKLPADPAIDLRGAKALFQVDGIPLVTCNDVGSGSAICLNIPFNYHRGYPTPDHLYGYLGDENHNRMIANIIVAILKAHKIDRPVPVVAPHTHLLVPPLRGGTDLPPLRGDGGEGGDWLAGLDTAYHADGKAQYIGLTERRVALDQVAQKLSFRARRPGHAYDMLEGKYLGQGEEWQTEIEPGGVKLFSVLPYQVKSLAVSATVGLPDRAAGTGTAGQASRGTEIQGTVRIETSGGRPERHVIHLDVARPDGQAVRYLARNLETRRGRASFSLPLALNEPEGRYTLRLTDIATGANATLQVDVRP